MNTLTLKIPQSLDDALQAASSKRHMSKSAMVRDALEKSLVEELKQTGPAIGWVTRWRGMMVSSRSASPKDDRVAHILSRHVRCCHSIQRRIRWTADLASASNYFTQTLAALAITRPLASSTQPTTRRRSGLAPGGMLMGRDSYSRSGTGGRCELVSSFFNSKLSIFHVGKITFLTKFRATGVPSVPAGTCSTSKSQAVSGWRGRAVPRAGFSSMDVPM